MIFNYFKKLAFSCKIKYKHFTFKSMVALALTYALFLSNTISHPTVLISSIIGLFSKIPINKYLRKPISSLYSRFYSVNCDEMVLQF